MQKPLPNRIRDSNTPRIPTLLACNRATELLCLGNLAMRYSHSSR